MDEKQKRTENEKRCRVAEIWRPKYNLVQPVTRTLRPMYNKTWTTRRCVVLIRTEGVQPTRKAIVGTNSTHTLPEQDPIHYGRCLCLFYFCQPLTTHTHTHISRTGIGFEIQMVGDGWTHLYSIKIYSILHFCIYTNNREIQNITVIGFYCRSTPTVN